MITLPGFRAEACLGRTTATATSSRRRLIDQAEDTVRPAQGSRLDAILEALSATRSGEKVRYAVPVDLDCPTGQMPTLVCMNPIPQFECEWTSAATYRCWVKKWECLPGGYGWQCQPVKLQVLGE
jgi:hypothetical protein